MSRRVVIELEDSEYRELLDLYKDFQKNNPQMASEVKFEDFVGSIIRTNLEAKRQMDKMGDSFKSMIEMFNPADVEAMLKSFAKNFPERKPEHGDQEPKKEMEATKKEDEKADDDDLANQEYKS